MYTSLHKCLHICHFQIHTCKLNINYRTKRFSRQFVKNLIFNALRNFNNFGRGEN